MVWRGIILDRAAPCGACFSALHQRWVATMIVLLCLEGTQRIGHLLGAAHSWFRPWARNTPQQAAS